MHVGGNQPGRLATTAAAAAALVAVLLFPATAAGYSPTAAAQYADAHWNTCGSADYPCISSSDCTNFASQVIFAGGVDMRGLPYGSLTDGHNWYAVNSLLYTRTWTFAENLYDFLIWDVPGGYLQKTWSGTSLPADSQGSTGDLIFYDWNPAVPDGGSEPRDHVNPIVAYGDSNDYEPGTHDSYFGDLIDGHSSYRYHYFWGLLSVNQNRLTTKFYVMHILSTN